MALISRPSSLENENEYWIEIYIFFEVNINDSVIDQISMSPFPYRNNNPCSDNLSAFETNCGTWGSGVLCGNTHLTPTQLGSKI